MQSKKNLNLNLNHIRRTTFGILVVTCSASFWLANKSRKHSIYLTKIFRKRHSTVYPPIVIKDDPMQFISILVYFIKTSPLAEYLGGVSENFETHQYNSSTKLIWISGLLASHRFSVFFLSSSVIMEARSNLVSTKTEIKFVKVMAGFYSFTFPF